MKQSTVDLMDHLDDIEARLFSHIETGFYGAGAADFISVGLVRRIVVFVPADVSAD